MWTRHTSDTPAVHAMSLTMSLNYYVVYVLCSGWQHCNPALAASVVNKLYLTLTNSKSPLTSSNWSSINKVVLLLLLLWAFHQVTWTDDMMERCNFCYHMDDWVNYIFHFLQLRLDFEQCYVQFELFISVVCSATLAFVLLTLPSRVDYQPLFQKMSPRSSPAEARGTKRVAEIEPNCLIDELKQSFFFSWEQTNFSLSFKFAL